MPQKGFPTWVLPAAFIIAAVCIFDSCRSNVRGQSGQPAQTDAVYSTVLDVWVVDAILPEVYVKLPDRKRGRAGRPTRALTWKESMVSRTVARQRLMREFTDRKMACHKNLLKMIEAYQTMSPGADREAYWRLTFLEWMIITDSLDFNRVELYPPGTDSKKRKWYQSHRAPAS